MFEPWIGERYEGSPLGLRVLVVGESHYGGADVAHDPLFTQTVISNYLTGLWHLEYYTKVAHLFPGGEDTHGFWRSVAFINYVPDCMPDRDVRPTPEQFEAGWPVLRRRVEELRPNLIVGTGTTVSRSIGAHVQLRPEPAGEAITVETGRLDGATIGFVVHPAAGGGRFRRAVETAKVTRLMQLARHSATTDPQ